MSSSAPSNDYVRTLREELGILADHAHAQGYEKAGVWIDKQLRPRRQRATRMAPPPKTPNLDRQPHRGDSFRNLRTGWGATAVGDPEGGYIEMLNGLRHSTVQVNRLLDSKLYAYEGDIGR